MKLGASRNGSPDDIPRERQTTLIGWGTPRATLNSRRLGNYYTCVLKGSEAVWEQGHDTKKRLGTRLRGSQGCLPAQADTGISRAGKALAR